jgi:hypothetical protein
MFLNSWVRFNLGIRLLIQGASPMKNPFDVMRMKEQEISRIKQEIEALRITAKLLGEEPPNDGKVEYRQVVSMP